MPSKRWNAGKLALWLLPLGFLLAFYFFPMGKIVVLALSKWRQNGLTGWDWGLVGRTAGFTFYQAALSTLLTLVLGMPAAFFFAAFNSAAKASCGWLPRCLSSCLPWWWRPASMP